jgi:hypothetical protein
MKPPPLDKVQIIERSLHCFTFGLVGILPGIGLPFAIISLGDCLTVMRHKGSNWNPAERHLRWGVAFAAIGLLTTMLLACVFAIELSWVR